MLMDDATLIKMLIRKIDDLASSADDDGEVQNLDVLSDTITLQTTDSVVIQSHMYRFCGSSVTCGGAQYI
jgi:hypothetical protein